VNINDEMSENEVLRAAAVSLSALPVAHAPDARAIMARGRARRNRRLAGIGLAGTVTAAASALGLASVLAGGPAPALASGGVQTAAFTLVKNANGTTTLTLSLDQVFNPAALQQALARDGIPALVKAGIYCTSQPAMSQNGIVSVQLPDGTPVARSSPGHQVPVPADAVTVINPAAMPAGTELFFDYTGSHRLTGDLIDAGSYTCGGQPPSAG
jgi:hypothetical protein